MNDTLKKLFSLYSVKNAKKISKVRLFLEWVLLGIVILCIFYALVLEAPWKVKGVLLIFLLACTILPYKYRKWFWLGTGLVILYLTVWVLLPDDRNWEPCKYNYTAKIASMNEKRLVPEKENAAVIFTSIIKDYPLEELVPHHIKPETYITTQSRPWESEAYPAIAQWLSQKEDVINRYIKGASKSECYYPILEEDIEANRFVYKRKHLPRLHMMSSILLSSAANDLAEGRTEDGLLKQTSVLRVSEQLFRQAVIHDMMAGIEMQNSALNQIQVYTVLYGADDYYLEKMEQSLSTIEHGWQEGWERISEYEQLDKINFFCEQFYEQNPQGHVRIRILNHILPATIIRNQQLPYWPKRVAKVQNILFRLFLPSRPEGLYDSIQSSLADYAFMEDYYTGPRERRQIPPYEQFKMNFSCYVKWYMNSLVFNIFEYYMRHKIEVQAGRILIGLRRYQNKHGYWPSSLSDIKSLTDTGVFIDIVNGEELVYKRTGDTFVLYSKGFNGIDDKGKHWESDFNSRNSDDWLIWPPRQ